MKLQHPETKNIFEVDEGHGKRLLARGFYKEYIEVAIEKEESPTVSPKRVSKKSSHKSGEK